MKYVFASIITLFAFAFFVLSINTISNTNLPINATQTVRSFEVGSRGSFKVSPGGEFVFTRIAVISCESKKPFSVTGMVSNLENKIEQYQVAGRFMVTGSSKVKCDFVSQDSLPVAYAVLQNKSQMVFAMASMTFGATVCLIMYVISLITIFRIWK